ncbi:MAG: WG repeat-containing protein [Planctomycetota bacterium]
MRNKASRVTGTGRIPRYRGPCVAALAVVLGVTAAAQPESPRVGIFGQTTRPDAVRLANAGLHDDLRAVNIGGYWGLINQKIRLVAVPEFDWTDDGYDGLARAVVNGKTGFLLGNGNWRFLPELSAADRFEEGFAVFRGPDGGYGYLDKAKTIRHQPDFDAASPTASARPDNRAGLPPARPPGRL